jgi:hypothetical protein
MMKQNSGEALKNLNKEYISETRKFVYALEENASQKDLLSIRDRIKNIFYKFKSINDSENPQKDINSTLP